MRALLVFLVVVASLGRLDRPAAREWLRRLAVRLGRAALAIASRPLPLPEDVTLVVAPHPDDETLGCGALIAELRRRAVPVHVLFLTDGGASHAGHPSIHRDEMVRRRHGEALDALGILGVDAATIHFLNHPDGTLGDLEPAQHTALVEAIARQLAAIRPLFVFAPCQRDGSSEHDAAFALVSAALATAMLDRQPQVWEYPVWLWRNPALLFRRIAAAAERSRVPAENVRDLKRRAIGCYRSQTEPLPPQTTAALPADFVRALDGPAEYFLRF